MHRPLAPFSKLLLLRIFDGSFGCLASLRREELNNPTSMSELLTLLYCNI